MPGPQSGFEAPPARSPVLRGSCLLTAHPISCTRDPRRSPCRAFPETSARARKRRRTSKTIPVCFQPWHNHRRGLWPASIRVPTPGPASRTLGHKSRSAFPASSVAVDPGAFSHTGRAPRCPSATRSPRPFSAAICCPGILRLKRRDHQAPRQLRRRVGDVRRSIRAHEDPAFGASVHVDVRIGADLADDAELIQLLDEGRANRRALPEQR